MRFTDAKSLEEGIAVFRALGVDPLTVTGGEFTVEAISEDEVLVRWASFAIAPAEDIAAALGTSA